MREEVAKATLCQPRLTLALLVHSDQYSITVSSRTKHTPSTPAPPTIYPLFFHLRLIPLCSLDFLSFTNNFYPSLSLRFSITLWLFSSLFHRLLVPRSTYPQLRSFSSFLLFYLLNVRASPFRGS